MPQMGANWPFFLCALCKIFVFLWINFTTKDTKMKMYFHTVLSICVLHVQTCRIRSADEMLLPPSRRWDSFRLPNAPHKKDRQGNHQRWDRRQHHRPKFILSLYPANVFVQLHIRLFQFAVQLPLHPFLLRFETFFGSHHRRLQFS